MDRVTERVLLTSHSPSVQPPYLLMFKGNTKCPEPSFGQLQEKRTINETFDGNPKPTQGLFRKINRCTLDPLDEKTRV